jgi:hypothetical protein
MAFSRAKFIFTIFINIIYSQIANLKMHQFQLCYMAHYWPSQGHSNWVARFSSDMSRPKILSRPFLTKYILLPTNCIHEIQSRAAHCHLLTDALSLQKFLKPEQSQNVTFEAIFGSFLSSSLLWFSSTQWPTNQTSHSWFQGIVVISSKKEFKSGFS